MTDDRTREILEQALQLLAEERSAFLDRECGEDEELRRKVEELLQDDSRHMFGDTVSVQGPPVGSDPTSRLDQIRSHASSPERYQLKGRIGRGGQGAVYEVWDEDLSRRLAMKVVLGKEDVTSPTDTPPADPATLSRFLEEAQIAGQLDHPGVVPVHELGVDPDGHVFFTMRLVKGDDFAEIIRKVHAGEDGWTQVRALGVILKACEALAYAHAKGVIHRDLKPSNLMVGKYGEVYVMDWGLARVMGQSDHHDLRLQEPLQTSSLQTDRREARHDLDSPLITMDGHVLGTPSYMPPEQAEGRVEDMGPASDVYSMGAVMYQLVTGQVPYVPEHGRISPRTVHIRVLDGPPTPIAELSPQAPAELVAITDRAMSRDSAQRYLDMNALASDLRAMLEGRVVSAFESGPWAELRKWVKRNRGWAATSGVAALLLLLALSWALMEREAALDSEGTTRSKYEELLRLADLELLEQFHSRVIELDRNALDYPEAVDQLLGSYLDPVLSRYPIHVRTLQDLQNNPEVREQGEFSLRAQQTQWYMKALERLTSEIKRVRDPGEYPHSRPALLELREAVSNLRDATVTTKSAREAWRLLEGQLSPQLGLLPLRQSPTSGLWEFWHVPSGTRPEPKAEHDGYALTPQSGLVFVLIPSDGQSPGFLISKYEASREQWARLGGAVDEGNSTYDRTLEPARFINWHHASTILLRCGLRLPTEREWEWAARGGTSSAWWTGDDLVSTAGAIIPRNTDEYADLGPIGHFRPNAFGLYNVIGGVREFCMDFFDQSFGEEGTIRMPEHARPRVARGGAWSDRPETSTSSYRTQRLPYQGDYATGVRPARTVTSPDN